MAEAIQWVRLGVLARAIAFLGLWLILSGFDLSELVVGALAAVPATWASMRLLPPGRSRPRALALARYALHFGRTSIVAGVDVARRALDPRLPLRSGFVVFDPRLPPGLIRDEFCTISSLLPGTLPCGSSENGSLLIHCLDTGQPVVEQLTAEESAFVHAIGGERQRQ